MSNSLFQQVIDTGITFSTKPTITPLTATRLVSTDAGNVLQSVTIANANGCNVSFSGSTLTNTMTQNLDVTGSPTFVGLTTSGATASTLLGTTTGKALQSVTIQNQNGCNASYNSTCGNLMNVCN